MDYEERQEILGEISEGIRRLLKENNYTQETFGRKYFEDFQVSSYKTLGGLLGQIMKGKLHGGEGPNDRTRKKLAMVLHRLPGEKWDELVEKVQMIEPEMPYPSEEVTLEKYKPKINMTINPGRRCKEISDVVDDV